MFIVLREMYFYYNSLNKTKITIYKDEMKYFLDAVETLINILFYTSTLFKNTFFKTYG